MTAHKCEGGLKKKFDLRSGFQRHRHFIGFFNVPVQAPTRGRPFYTVIPRNHPHLVAFYDTLGIRRTHSRLNPPPPPPRGSPRGRRGKKNMIDKFLTFPFVFRCLQFTVMARLHDRPNLILTTLITTLSFKIEIFVTLK